MINRQIAEDMPDDGGVADDVSIQLAPSQPERRLVEAVETQSVIQMTTDLYLGPYYQPTPAHMRIETP